LPGGFINPIYIPILPLAKSFSISLFLTTTNIFVISYLLHFIFRFYRKILILFLSVPFYFFNNTSYFKNLVCFDLPKVSSVGVYDFCIMLNDILKNNVKLTFFPETFVFIKSKFELLKIFKLSVDFNVDVCFGAIVRDKDDLIDNCVIRINKFDGVKIYKKKKLVPIIECDLNFVFMPSKNFCSGFKESNIYICSEILLSDFGEVEDCFFCDVILFSSNYWTMTKFTWFYANAVYCYKNLHSAYMNKKILFIFDKIIAI
jgi:hypothetical protein